MLTLDAIGRPNGARALLDSRFRGNDGGRAHGNDEEERRNDLVEIGDASQPLTTNN